MLELLKDVPRRITNYMLAELTKRPVTQACAAMGVKARRHANCRKFFRPQNLQSPTAPIVKFCIEKIRAQSRMQREYIKMILISTIYIYIYMIFIIILIIIIIIIIDYISDTNNDNNNNNNNNNSNNNNNNDNIDAKLARLVADLAGAARRRVAGQVELPEAQARGEPRAAGAPADRAPRGRGPALWRARRGRRRRRGLPRASPV